MRGRAYLLRMRDDMVLLHKWDNNYLFCSLTRLSNGLGFAMFNNRGNRDRSLAIF